MKSSTRAAIILACLATAQAGAAQAQTAWIKDQLSASCSAASKEKIGNNTRKNIEDSVKRAEASIKPPAPIMDLGCLDSLMQAPLDVFSSSWQGGIGFDLNALMADLTSGLTNVNIGDPSAGVSRMICNFAEAKFQELTEGLSGTMDEITSGVDMPKFTGNFNISAMVNDGSGSLNSGSGFAMNNLPTSSGAPAVSASPTSTGGAAAASPTAQSIWNITNGLN